MFIFKWLARRPSFAQPALLVVLHKMATKIDDSGLVFETSEDVEVLPTFDALGLKEDLLRGVYACKP